jgi:lipopolysaccharide/colanic/teichoic acid biosynthesis glycosyltransferase
MKVEEVESEASNESEALPFIPSTWSCSWMKHIFDFLLAAFLVVSLSPLFVVVAIAIRLTSKGPVFFRQVRLGKDQRPFRIFKFRTMRHWTNRGGSHITVALDPRITGIGRFLRKYKLDEVPQLLNVLAGEMSFVGPRPRVPEQVQDFDVLTLRPGLTAESTLCFRHEELLFRNLHPEELTHMYHCEIVPVKRYLDRDYFGRATFGSDFGLILRTAVAVLSTRPHQSIVQASRPELFEVGVPAFGKESAFANQDGD